MAEAYGRDGDGEYHRPRRPNEETIAYLRGLPLDAAIAVDEIDGYLEFQRTLQVADDATQPPEFPQTFAAAFAALDEIRNEIASLAGDEYGSQSIELLAHITAPYSELAARVLLNGCAGYYLHLAMHRYGSHVVQTILQLAVKYKSTESDLSINEDCPQYSGNIDSLPSLEDLVHGIVEELAPHVSTLAIHVCGTHVLRTLLCVLGGIDLVGSPGRPQNHEYRGVSGALLRGRKKDKKKKKKRPSHGDGSNDAVSHAGLMNIEYCTNFRLESAHQSLFQSLLALTDALTGEFAETPGELQTLACHASAGPLLIVLLRVLTYSADAARKTWLDSQIQSDGSGDGSNKPSSAIGDFRLGIARDEPKFELHSSAHSLVKRLLCWKDGEEQDWKAVGDILYGLSGEPRGSHVFETTLRISPDSVYADVVRLADFANPSSMQEYAEHDVSNFVVQTMLCTVRTKEQAEDMLKSVERVITSGLAIDPRRKRRGILWRSVELAAKYRVYQDSLLKAIKLGFIEHVRQLREAEGTEAATGTTKKKERKRASAMEVSEMVSRLIDLRQPAADNGSERPTLDSVGCRTVYNLLRFVPRVCEDILKAITDDITADDLVCLAKDGLGSRCIMDGILDGPTKGPIFAAAVKRLYAKLSGHWIHLSLDRVGHHTVKKTFNALPKIDDKAKLVEELASAGNRLNGNAMGRSVVNECAIEEYREGKKRWRQLIAKRLTKSDEKWVDDLASRRTATSLNDGKVGRADRSDGANDTGTRPSDANGVDVDKDLPSAAPVKAKRKRKRKKSSKNDPVVNDEPMGVDNDTIDSSKRTKPNVSTVDDIIETLTTPQVAGSARQ